MIQSNRPLSPHLQIYRPQITSVLSILHRVTGVFICLGLVLLTGWLVAAASGQESYQAMHGFMNSFFVKFILFGWSFALFYHLANGVRHLIWDAGFGFDMNSVEMSGKSVIAATIVLTILVWLFA